MESEDCVHRQPRNVLKTSKEYISERTNYSANGSEDFNVFTTATNHTHHP